MHYFIRHCITKLAIIKKSTFLITKNPQLINGWRSINSVRRTSQPEGRRINFSLSLSSVQGQTHRCSWIKSKDHERHHDQLFKEVRQGKRPRNNRKGKGKSILHYLQVIRPIFRISTLFGQCYRQRAAVQHWRRERLQVRRYLFKEQSWVVRRWYCLRAVQVGLNPNLWYFGRLKYHLRFEAC